VRSESDSSDDEVKPKVTEKPKKKKEKKEKREKEARKERKEKKEKKAKKEKKVEKEKREEKKPPAKISPKKREKTKRALSPPSEASDLDDAPPARAPPTKQKKPNSRGGGDFDENEDKGLDIGHNRFVQVKCFKGKQYLDIREYFNSAKGLMPGKKGVTLKREQWNSFRDAFFDIDEKCQTAGAEDEEPMDLGLNKRIAVSKFKAKYLLIDIREMYDKDGEQRPGKGIALKPENYNKIKEYQNEIDEMW